MVKNPIPLLSHILFFGTTIILINSNKNFLLITILNNCLPKGTFHKGYTIQTKTNANIVKINRTLSR